MTLTTVPITDDLLRGALELEPTDRGLVAGLGAAGRSDVLAALLVYRLIYYLLPFVVLFIPALMAMRRQSGRGR